MPQIYFEFPLTDTFPASSWQLTAQVNETDDFKDRQRTFSNNGIAHYRASVGALSVLHRPQPTSDSDVPITPVKYAWVTFLFQPVPPENLESTSPSFLFLEIFWKQTHALAVRPPVYRWGVTPHIMRCLRIRVLFVGQYPSVDLPAAMWWLILPHWVCLL